MTDPKTHIFLPRIPSRAQNFMIYAGFFWLFFVWILLFLAIFDKFFALFFVLSDAAFSFFTHVFYAVIAITCAIFLHKILGSRAVFAKFFFTTSFCIFSFIFIFNTLQNHEKSVIFLDELSFFDILYLKFFDIATAAIFYIFFIFAPLFFAIFSRQTHFLPSIFITIFALIASSFQVFYARQAAFFYIDLGVFCAAILLFCVFFAKNFSIIKNSRQILKPVAFLGANAALVAIFHVFFGADLSGIFTIRCFFYELTFLFFAYEIFLKIRTAR